METALDECDGIVVYQFAVKHKKREGETEAEKQALLTLISKENKLAADALEKSNWAPDCNLEK